MPVTCSQTTSCASSGPDLVVKLDTIVESIDNLARLLKHPETKPNEVQEPSPKQPASPTALPETQQHVTKSPKSNAEADDSIISIDDHMPTIQDEENLNCKAPTTQYKLLKQTSPNHSLLFPGTVRT